MASDKQAKANRQNARKSTGPKTPEGKAAVRLNALRHGILSKEILLPGEDEEALTEVGKHLRAELQPVGELENLLVDRIIAVYWRLRRVGRVETGIFARELYQELAERARQEVSAYEKSRLETVIEKTTEPPTITDERKHQEALSKTQEIQAKLDAEIAILGHTFIRDANEANAFAKLSRYETALERSLYKALHELQRLQAARRADGNATPPVAIDVDVTGVSRDEP